MDIFCPHCQNRLTIEDNHAGQFLKCPLCSGMFTAPALPAFVPAAAATPLPPPPPPQPAAPETFRLEPLPHERPSTTPLPVTTPLGGNGSVTVSPPVLTPTVPTPPPVTPPPEPDIDTAPLPVGEYRRAFIVNLNPDTLRWFGPTGLGLVFLLSFFVWYGGEVGLSLWGLAFTRGTTMAVFLPYLMFLFISLVLSIVSMLLTKRIVVLPEPFKKLRPWRSLIVAGVTALAFAILFFNWIYLNFNTTVNPSTGWYKIAVRLHGLALIGLLLEFWLDRRHKKNLPLPKIELRW